METNSTETTPECNDEDKDDKNNDNDEDDNDVNDNDDASYRVEEEQPPLPVGRPSRFFAWARRGRELPQRISFIFLAQTVYKLCVIYLKKMWG